MGMDVKSVGLGGLTFGTLCCNGLEMVGKCNAMGTNPQRPTSVPIHGRSVKGIDRAVESRSGSTMYCVGIIILWMSELRSIFFFPSEKERGMGTGLMEAWSPHPPSTQLKIHPRMCCSMLPPLNGEAFMMIQISSWSPLST